MLFSPLYCRERNKGAIANARAATEADAYTFYGWKLWNVWRLRTLLHLMLISQMHDGILKAGRYVGRILGAL